MNKPNTDIAHIHANFLITTTSFDVVLGAKRLAFYYLSQFGLALDSTASFESFLSISFASAIWASYVAVSSLNLSDKILCRALPPNPLRLNSSVSSENFLFAASYFSVASLSCSFHGRTLSCHQV